MRHVKKHVLHHRNKTIRLLLVDEKWFLDSHGNENSMKFTYVKGLHAIKEIPFEYLIQLS